MSKSLLTVGILAACVAASSASAQGQQDRDRTRTPDQTRQTDMDRVQDRDRMMDRDLSKDRDMARDQDRDRDRDRDVLSDRDRDRDRLLQQDRDRIFASELMTPQERTQYLNQLRALRTEQERVQFRLDHQQKMQLLAKERNAKLGSAATRNQLETQERERQRERTQIFGYELMDQGELDRYREQLRSARTQDERERIQSEHRLAMQERSREKGVPLATDK